MVIGGTHTQILAAALRGLDAQRQAHEFNLANIETPGFKARVVSFEHSLQRAVSTRNPGSAAIDTTTSTAATRIDGNNVQMDDEVTALELNTLRQRLVTTALNDHFARLRATLGS